jgi:pyruvate dehydrogenase E1 component
MSETPVARPGGLDTVVLETIASRVLWLATAIVHHANHVRANPSGIKVGGHQTSSASMVSIMTSLWFEHLEAPDRVSVKPHASPVLHAIEFLLGRLSAEDLTTLRQFGGLQSYPSRTKDPVPADYSTGSVGIGATAPIWGALAHRYLEAHFDDVPQRGRQISLVGDAELDEGAVWETVADPMVSDLGEVLWIIDVNRQSLDRVVPHFAAHRLTTMFEAAGWHTQTVKYGRRLEDLFARDSGEALRRRIDAMDNGEYQRLLRADGAGLRERLPGAGRGRRGLERLVADLSDDEIVAAIRDLGGHDQVLLTEAYRAADAASDRPSIVFAYTIKGWSLPTEGHPNNHSALLSPEQFARFGAELGIDAREPFVGFEPGTQESRAAARVAHRLERPRPEAPPTVDVPAELGRTHSGRASTQTAFGRVFADLPREAPAAAARVVTVSPDVASSTNLSGWVHRTGVFNVVEHPDWFEDDPDSKLRWAESHVGQHIELGIAETNLVCLLGELGATWRQHGQPLLPVGTLYDPFVARALEPWSFGIYGGGQSILVGTPSGITLAPEGGAHQSISTPSIGLEQPGCIAWEPAFAQDFEWAFLRALASLGRPDGSSAYFRLSTRRSSRISPGCPTIPTRAPRAARACSPAATASSATGAATLSWQASGRHARGHRRRCRAGRRGPGRRGAVRDLGRPALSRLPGLARPRRRGEGDPRRPAAAGSRAPIVTVLDGHPHTLSFLGAVRQQPISCLGVDAFGQSGQLEDLYRHYGIDTDTIVGAAADLLDGAALTGGN